MPTAAERAQWYFEGIDLGANLYDSDAPDIPGHLPDLERHRTTGPNDMEGLFSGPSDTKAMFSGRDDMEASYSGPTDMEGSELEGGSGHKQVQFTLPRQPRPRGDSDP